MNYIKFYRQLESLEKDHFILPNPSRTDPSTTIVIGEADDILPLHDIDTIEYDENLNKVIIRWKLNNLDLS